jgi:hypothetical protein
MSEYSPNSQYLAVAKIKHRQALLAQDPKTAQENVNQILHPHLWQRDSSQGWTETLEPNYGTSNP